MILGGIGTVAAGPASTFGAADFAPANAAAPLSAESEHWLGTALAVLGSLGAGAGGWALLTGRNRTQRVHVEAQPDQRQAVRLATWEELSALRLEFTEMKGEFRQRCQHVEDKVETAKETILEAGEERAVKIHERVNSLAEKVGELIGQLKRGGRA